jgi:hypothetical protein
MNECIRRLGELSDRLSGGFASAIARDASPNDRARPCILRSDDKRRARLNCIAHLLRLIPYKKLPQPKVKLPKRSLKNAYDDNATLNGRKFISDKF